MTNDSFKKLNSGDIIVYINLENDFNSLTFGKIYKILSIEDCYDSIYIENDFNLGLYIHYKYFVTLKEYEIIQRKNKLEKIFE